MAAPDPTEARFPDVPMDSGHYESFYLKACHPDQALGIWIRYTVHKRPGARPNGSLWVTLFDGAAQGPRAHKATLPEPRAGDGDWIAVGEALMRPGVAVGAVEGAEWDLRFRDAEPPLYHLPLAWLYRTPLPRTKLLSPAPNARFDGSVNVDGRVVSVAGWHGMVGHNWGAQHAERWIWLHGLAAAGDWLDVALARIKVARFTTPWMASGAVSLDGRREPLGGPGRRIQVRESPTRCDFMVGGRGVRLNGAVEAQRKDFVGFVYADPDGSEHHTVNCSTADMHVTLEHNGSAERELVVRGGAAYELGMRERDHGMPIQPFPDG